MAIEVEAYMLSDKSWYHRSATPNTDTSNCGICSSGYTYESRTAEPSCDPDHLVDELTERVSVDERMLADRIARDVSFVFDSTKQPEVHKALRPVFTTEEIGTHVHMDLYPITDELPPEDMDAITWQIITRSKGIAEKYCESRRLSRMLLGRKSFSKIRKTRGQTRLIAGWRNDVKRANGSTGRTFEVTLPDSSCERETLLQLLHDLKEILCESYLHVLSAGNAVPDSNTRDAITRDVYKNWLAV